ncbi:MAG: hypothetical protein Q9157_008239 [Trypethelium eluteriae]
MERRPSQQSSTSWNTIVAWANRQRSTSITLRPNSIVNQAEVEEALRRLCMPTMDMKTGTMYRIATETIQQISNALTFFDRQERRGESQYWRTRPRIYTVLRIIGCMHLMDFFVGEGFTDIDLPFSHFNFPGFLEDESIRANFLKYQKCVLTDAQEIEKGNHHVSLEDSGNQHFHSIATIGQGGFGSVGQVRSKLSQKFFARKRVPRGRPSERNLEVQRFLIKEIKFLRGFDHRHVVRILGSYTDKDCIAFLMQPIADHDLYSFLVESRPSQGQFMSMRNYFGCLAGAVDYLHTRKIRHRDLISKNILIKGDRIFITDFGIAYDWSKTNATTQHRDVPFSKEYTSPEVIKGTPRNTASDMWSLGVVFLELVTVLLGSTIAQFKSHMDYRSSRKSSGRSLPSIEPYAYANLLAVNDWMEILQ